MTPPLTTYLDPGILGSGLSVFAGKDLYGAAYVPNPVDKAASSLARRVAMARALVEKLDAWGIASRDIVAVGVEDPQILDSRHQSTAKQRADPNDLLNLPGVTAAFAALLGGLPPEALYSVKPGEWKENIDKNVMCARIWGRLTPVERARVERLPARQKAVDPDAVPGGLMHNALDAIGIGLHFLGRLERVRVFG